MSNTTFYSLLVPSCLAITGFIVMFVLRNEMPDGTARPVLERLRVAAITFVVLLGLGLFAAFLPTWFAVYFIIWWVTLFAVLPLGITSQHEAGEVVRGTEAGAPVAPDLRRKAVLTTLISLPVFAAAMAAVYFLPIL